VESPLVSYIVITMDRRDELAGCLRNLQQQDYPGKQIIVVDNGSSDGTAAMVSGQFPEVDLIILKTNQGVAGGRNRAMEMARGELCIFIDDDARLADRQATRRTITYFKDDPQLACVAFFIRYAHTGCEQTGAIPRWDKRSIDEDYACSYFCGGGFALRRRIFMALGMFWETLWYGGEELDFSYRLLDKGYRLLRSAGIVVDHYEVPTSRPGGQWIYFNARNRCWIAVRNLPWLYAATTSLAWWCYTAYIDMKSGHFTSFARGFRDALSGLPAVLRARRCIGKRTVEKLRKLSGRRWW